MRVREPLPRFASDDLCLEHDVLCFTNDDGWLDRCAACFDIRIGCLEISKIYFEIDEIYFDIETAASTLTALYSFSDTRRITKLTF